MNLSGHRPLPCSCHFYSHLIYTASKWRNDPILVETIDAGGVMAGIYSKDEWERLDALALKSHWRQIACRKYLKNTTIPTLHKKSKYKEILMSGIMSLPKITESSSVVIHTLCFPSQSEVTIHAQESTTAEKVTDVVECIICCDERISNQMPTLIHRTNKDCNLFKNKQVCHICMPRLERCPVCRENLTTGEMQNSLADILVEMQQNNLQVQEEGEEDQLAPIAQNQQAPIININVNVQNPNLVQEQQNRPSLLRKICILSCGVFVPSFCYVGLMLGVGYGIRTNFGHPTNSTHN